MSDRTDFHEESQRLQLVATARDASEYDLFVTAWTSWHGSAPPPGRIDADFGAYLREEAIPHYVRHFVRHSLDSDPDLRRRHAEDCRAARRARRLTFALIVLAVVLALVVGRLA